MLSSSIDSSTANTLTKSGHFSAEPERSRQHCGEYACCRRVSTAVPRAQHSTAHRHHPSLHKAASQVRADQVTYKNKSMYCVQHACGVRVVFLAHGTLGTCRSPVCTFNVEPSTSSILIHLSVIPFHFFYVGESSGRNRPLREAPCIVYQVCQGSSECVR